MVWQVSHDWRPTRLLTVAASSDTSTGVTEVTTDAGRAYLKPMGNRQGPHVLATDLVGTHLARWFGLVTPDVSVMPLDEDDQFDLPRGYHAEPGPAFVSRAMNGDPWGKSGLQLDLLDNPDDVTALVVFDTWCLNCDRHHHDLLARKPNYDNVFLCSDGVEPPARRLVALDHGLCFIRSGEDLSPKLAHIHKAKDENVYGLFPEFRGRLRVDMLRLCATRLRDMDAPTANAMISSIPTEWEVDQATRAAWADLICRRASLVADHAEEWISGHDAWLPGEEP